MPGDISGLLEACLYPLTLTVVLFAGPLMTTAAGDHARLRFRSKLYYWRQNLTDWIAWRNYVVAPFTEEFTFRSVTKDINTAELRSFLIAKDCKVFPS